MLNRNHRVDELIHRGDFAFAYAEREELSRVCAELREVLDGQLAVDAERLAKLLHESVEPPIRLWVDLAAAVRSERWS
jgi:hypothetical protein